MSLIPKREKQNQKAEEFEASPVYIRSVLKSKTQFIWNDYQILCHVYFCIYLPSFYENTINIKYIK